MDTQNRNVLKLIGPGILIAATGVGAGDLLTASLGGSAVGLVILWAVVGGAVVKWFLNEGIARWQMATETSLLEGWAIRLGGWIQWMFLIYLINWTFLTGGALITACGVAGTGLLPLTNDPNVSKIYWGIVHSGVGLILVLFGGFKVFEKLMSICIAVMFSTVLVTAILLKPDWVSVGHHLVVPSIPAGGMGWTVGILGGVGGTVTLLSYGYWIREKDRGGMSGLKTCRIDLGIGYTMTALFGIAMVIIGSRVHVEGSGVRVAPMLADQLGNFMGPTGRWIFLIGFWGAVFSSLLGVWQSVPYLFADFIRIRKGLNDDLGQMKDLTKTTPYRIYLFAIAILPLPELWISVKKVQLAYAVFGALFMPLLALTLLIMNNHKDWIKNDFRNRWITNIVLSLTMVFFIYIWYTQVADIIMSLI